MFKILIKSNTFVLFIYLFLNYSISCAYNSDRNKKNNEIYKNNLIKRKLLLESYERCEEYINNSSVELFLNCSNKDMNIKKLK